MAPLGETSLTVGEFIEGVIVKELWARQAPSSQHDNFDREQWVEFLRSLCPTVVEETLSTLRAWIPAIAEVTPSTLVPDLDEYPAGSEDSPVGLTLEQRRLVLDSLEIILDTLSFADNKSSNNSDDTRLYALSRQGLACCAAQISALFEHFVLLFPDAATWPRLHGGGSGFGDDLSTVKRSVDAPALACCELGNNENSKDFLIKELQSCKKHIFDLEQELVMQARTADDIARRQSREADRTVQRLLAVNMQLEEKLRGRTEDWRSARSLEEKTHRKMVLNQYLLDEKQRKIDILEKDLERFHTLQTDLLAREKEVGQRMLRAHISEFERLSKLDDRAKRFQLLMQGQSPTPSSSAETTIAKQVCIDVALQMEARKAVEDVIAEFDDFFDRREQRVLMQIEGATDSISKSSGKIALRPQFGSPRSVRVQEMVDSEVQTDAQEELRVRPRVFGTSSSARSSVVSAHDERQWFKGPEVAMPKLRHDSVSSQPARVSGLMRRISNVGNQTPVVKRKSSASKAYSESQRHEEVIPCLLKIEFEKEKAPPCSGHIDNSSDSDEGLTCSKEVERSSEVRSSSKLSELAPPQLPSIGGKFQIESEEV